MFGSIIAKAAAGFSKGLGKTMSEGAIQATKQLSGRAISGALVGGLGTYGYNKATDNNISVGKGIMFGALTGFGLKAGGLMASNKISAPFLSTGIFNRMGSRIAASARSGLRRGISMSETLATSKFVNNNYNAILKYGSAAVPTALAGAGIGAGYGMFSDRESIMSGAFKGALAGAAYGMGRKAFNSYTHKAASVPRSGMAANPIREFKTGRTAEAEMRYQEYLSRKLKEKEGLNIFSGGRN